jgi:hypothetical protein
MTTKEKILEHFCGNFEPFFSKYLPGLKKIGGDEYAARCPFHEDDQPSLNVNGVSGRYFCHGCGKKGDPFHFYGKVNGLDTKADFGKILRGIAKDFGIKEEEQKGRVVKTYDYTDMAGKLAFQVCRMEPKDFRQRRPDGKGGWVWNLKETEPVLYRLPALAQADEVIIVEGEKDADALGALGFTTTTCPMGAGKWRPEYSDCLKGKAVVLIPDNDQAGREHMAAVGVSLRGKAKSIKWIDLPDLPSKGDVSDFIGKFQDPEAAAERLAIMIEGAGEYEPPRKLTVDDLVVTMAEFRTMKLPERKMIVNPFAPEKSIILIPGWRGVGKSMFAMGLLDAISRGENFGPWTTRPVPTLYLDAEMAEQDVQDRYLKMSDGGNGIEPIYFYSESIMAFHGLPRAHILSEAWRNEIRRLLVTRGVKLVFNST